MLALCIVMPYTHRAFCRTAALNVDGNSERVAM